MMIVMGAGSGAMVAHMHSVADASCGMLGGAGHPEYVDIVYGVDFDTDAGF